MMSLATKADRSEYDAAFLAVKRHRRAAAWRRYRWETMPWQIGGVIGLAVYGLIVWLFIL